MKEEITRNIFLGGGGGEADSAMLDQRFASCIDRSKTLIYIPVAMEAEKYIGCQQWFTSVFAPLGLMRIEMLTDLAQRPDPNIVAGVYIGGGNTVKLWHELRRNGFDTYLRQLVVRGIPIYGGSAGAIVLGKDLRISTEGESETGQTETMNVLRGYSVHCHTKTIAGATRAQETLRLPVIALSERSGAHLRDHEIEAVGFDSVWIVKGGTTTELKTGERHLLTTLS